MCLFKNKKFKSAFSLIEVLVVMFIAAVVFTSFYTVSMVGTRFIIEAKNRLAAVALANEKMEIIRNLQYDSVGLIGGIPDGNIKEDEDVTANSRKFHVHTFVKYVDDPFDGLYPADVINNDYKSVKVTISWNDSTGTAQAVDSVSRFVPPGLETADGGAPLAITVSGSDGVGVAQASVHVTNSVVVPVIDFTVQTDNSGFLMLPAAPASAGGYQLTISKSGYETVTTLVTPSLDYQSNPYTPSYGYVSVSLGSLNPYSYVEDKLANLTMQALDLQDNPVGNIAFKIDGGKILGRNASLVNVLNMHDSSSTNAVSGQKVYANISPGNYTIVETANAQYDLIDFDPATSPFTLTAGSSVTYTMRMADKNLDSITVNVLDSVTNLPIAEAKITLTDSVGNAVFTDKPCSTRGVAYYPDTATPLAAGTYTLKVSADGYTDQTTSITVNKLTKQDIKLVKS